MCLPVVRSRHQASLLFCCCCCFLSLFVVSGVGCCLLKRSTKLSLFKNRSKSKRLRKAKLEREKTQLLPHPPPPTLLHKTPRFSFYRLRCMIPGIIISQSPGSCSSFGHPGCVCVCVCFFLSVYKGYTPVYGDLEHEGYTRG